MDREVNIKYLFYAIIRSWKGILIAGIIGAVILGIIGILQVKTNAGMQEENYCTYGVLRIIMEDRQVQDKGGGVIKDVSAENESIIKSDAVLEKVINSKSICQYGLSIDELRKQIYFEFSQYGEIVDVSIVTENQQLSTLLCTIVLEYAREELSEYQKEVMVLQEPMERGLVTVEAWENINKPTEKADIIRDAEISTINIKTILKMVVAGCLLGIFVFCILVSIRFIVGDEICYFEQIEQMAGIRLLGILPQRKGREDI